MGEACSGAWIDILMDSVGKYLSVETGDGILREGKISGYRFKTMQFNGKEIQVPEEIEINGDPNDRIPLGRIAHLTIS